MAVTEARTQPTEHAGRTQTAVATQRADGMLARMPLVWVNIVSIAILHLVSLYAVLNAQLDFKALTWLWGIAVGGIGGFGITAGAHRLWTHRAYSAKLPLRIILAMCYSVAGQNTLVDWVRDHRVHHKFSETDADPHNASRGFFFAHVGWLLQKKHPEVLAKGRLIDMSDVLADPVVKFHMRYFWPLKMLFCFVIPICVPHFCWGEPWYNAFIAMGVIRYMLSLNFTWLVNSAAHLYGNRPFDKHMGPAENLAVAMVAMGEGWHNYHHVFPWDYKAAELGDYAVNLTTLYIDMFARLGWAYDLKQPTPELVRRTAAARGDGTYVEVPEPVTTPMQAVNKVFKYYGIQHKLHSCD